ncbi:hypothetical protein MHYP_G00033520 [Metynnis hypsauchen]
MDYSPIDLHRRFDSALRIRAEAEQRETENIDKERVLIGFLERAESGGQRRRSRREITCFCYRGSELCCAFRRPSGLSGGDEFSTTERLKKKPSFQTGASFDGSPGSGLSHREHPEFHSLSGKCVGTPSSTRRTLTSTFL